MTNQISIFNSLLHTIIKRAIKKSVRNSRCSSCHNLLVYDWYQGSKAHNLLKITQVYPLDVSQEMSKGNHVYTNGNSHKHAKSKSEVRQTTSTSKDDDFDRLEHIYYIDWRMIAGYNFRYQGNQTRKISYSGVNSCSCYVCKLMQPHTISLVAGHSDTGRPLTTVFIF